MYKNRKITASLTVLALIISAVAVYISATTESSNPGPLPERLMGNAKGFRVITVGTSFNGLCGEEKIVRVRDDAHIATLRVCEDNISDVTEDGEWVLVRTRCDRAYKKNLLTGEESLAKSTSCFGGGLSKAE